MSDLLHPSFRRRIALLAWSRRLLWVPAVALVLQSRAGWSLPVALFTCLVLAGALGAWEQSLRRQFIREAALPRFLVPTLRQQFPQLSHADAELVLRGLRQFFLAYLRSGRRFVAMPSKIADAAWHAYILHTRGYQSWCAAAFGRLLHHAPAEVMGRDARRNDGLRRCWYWACKEESIDPRTPTRLPLLFALDAKFGIPGGYRYTPDCRGQEGSGTQCGGSFGDADSGAAGDADGFGGSDGGAGGGDGDSGGCGGD